MIHYGAETTLLAGLGLVASGLLLFTRAPVRGHYLLDVLPVMVLLGGGVGLAFPAVMALAMSQATQDDAGLASGLINTSVQVGGALGLAVLVTLAASHTHHLRPPDSLYARCPAVLFSPVSSSASSTSNGSG